MLLTWCVEHELDNGWYATNFQLTKHTLQNMSSSPAHETTQLLHTNWSVTAQPSPYASYTDPAQPIIPFHKRPVFWLKVCIVLILITLIALAFAYYTHLLDALTLFLQWMTHHPIQGCFVYLVFCYFWLVFFLVQTVLTVGAGFVWFHVCGPPGIGVAIVLAVMGSQLGMAQAFVNGRFLCRPCVARLTLRYPQLQVMDAIVSRHGLKMCFLLRLTPLTPYNVMNYGMGATSVSFRDYVLGNFGLVPDAVMMCFVGSLLSSVYQIRDVEHSLGRRERRDLLIFTVGGTVVAVLLFVYVTWVARREFRKMTQQMESETEETIEAEIPALEAVHMEELGA